MSISDEDLYDLETRLSKALELLRELKWSSKGLEGESECPICYTLKGYPHGSSCRLAELLSEADGYSLKEKK